MSKSAMRRIIAQMEGEDSLAEKYIEYLEIASEDATVDDFFDYCGIPENNRSDFLYAAILKQALEITGKKI